MKLESKDFSNNELMDTKFTCDGKDISPQLEWTQIPESTKSFALSCIDPDAPAGDWIHWLVYKIPADKREIPQNGPVLGIEVENDFGKTDYGGPCPPSGTHRYFFRIYALDVENLDGINKNNFIDKVKEHTIESAEIIGLYKR
ncbi:MAG: YbhB/YbcL family Raf kinase inhibitor-like protein [Candidatus Lokiarchaeota archaeon]|nr:YbhB/YbcL family Raf kinase inhibitor-like protein [Candidatus Lokiarchaeota archaeon]MBD3342774.1 YbhB/YbcL family Raf kinase inhibitor-like protein [Candidatus Lokiarchaeota archaeon]